METDSDLCKKILLEVGFDFGTFLNNIDQSATDFI